MRVSHLTYHPQKTTAYHLGYFPLVCHSLFCPPTPPPAVLSVHRPSPHHSPPRYWAYVPYSVLYLAFLGWYIVTVLRFRLFENCVIAYHSRCIIYLKLKHKTFVLTNITVSLRSLQWCMIPGSVGTWLQSWWPSASERVFSSSSLSPLPHLASLPEWRISQLFGNLN